MDKLITHVPAGEVEEAFKELALTWPLWESRTHPQVLPLKGKTSIGKCCFLMDFACSGLDPPPPTMAADPQMKGKN